MQSADFIFHFFAENDGGGRGGLRGGQGVSISIPKRKENNSFVDQVGEKDATGLPVCHASEERNVSKLSLHCIVRNIHRFQPSGI